MQHLFWDSCVFTAFLNNETSAYDIDSIQQYLSEAAEGKWMIHTSSIAYAEVLSSHIKSTEYENFSHFLDDFTGAVVIQDATANIVQLAGKLREIPYKKGSETKRRLGTGDAIMLATPIYLQDVMGINFTSFHTFDKGKKRGEDGNKSIPLLTYEEWCEE